MAFLPLEALFLPTPPYVVIHKAEALDAAMAHIEQWRSGASPSAAAAAEDNEGSDAAGYEVIGASQGPNLQTAAAKLLELFQSIK